MHIWLYVVRRATPNDWSPTKMQYKKRNAYFIHYTYCRGYNMYNFCPTGLQRTELKCNGCKENNSSIWVARKFTRVLCRRANSFSNVYRHICHMTRPDHVIKRPIFNYRRRCQKIYTRAIVALGTMPMNQRLDLQGKAGHPVARESPLFLLV